MATTVDQYLAAVPKQARQALQRLRRIIRAAAPGAREVISYQIPTFRHHGGLVGFAASKAGDQCTFHLMSTAVLRAHAPKLKGYTLGKGSIRFGPDKPLPATLVTRLVKARMAENERLHPNLVEVE